MTGAYDLAICDRLEVGQICSDGTKGEVGGRSEVREAKLLPELFSKAEFQKLTGWGTGTGHLLDIFQAASFSQRKASGNAHLRIP